MCSADFAEDVRLKPAEPVRRMHAAPLMRVHGGIDIGSLPMPLHCQRFLAPALTVSAAWVPSAISPPPARRVPSSNRDVCQKQALRTSLVLVN